MKLSELKLNPDNPQKFDDLTKLEKSIKEFPKMMEIRPLVYDPVTKHVLGGNKRLVCLQNLGYKEISDNWAMSADKLTEDEKKRFIIADNVGFGEWDEEKLSDWDKQDLEDWGLDLDFDNVINENEDNEEYNIPDEIKTDIILGDKFKIGNHFLMCGDSTNKDCVLDLISNNLADLIFTDPPYDLEDSYSQNIFDSAKEDCHIFIMNSDKLLIQNVNNGFKWFRKFFAVDFRQARLVSNNQPMTRVDLIAEFCKGKTRFNNLFDGFSTLIECAKIHNNNESINFGHKQAKKTELPSTFILHYSKEKELIFDLFGGSGSTMDACEKHNRICYMMEYDPKNCQIIIDRMEKVYNIKAEKIN